ncbi:MFS transporter [Lachnospiraceae bacterium ZAX-1]
MKKPKVHYAWVISLACCILLFVSSGLAIGGFSIYLPNVKDANDFSNTQVSVIITVRSFLGLVSKLVVLWLIQKIEIRYTMTMACMMAGIAYLLYANSSTLTGFCIASAFAGMSYGFGSITPTSIVLHRWFKKKLDIALSICATGAGVAALICPAFITFLILNYDLPTAFYGIAFFCFFGGIIAFLLIRNYPADKALEPFGSKYAETMKSDSLSGNLPNIPIVHSISSRRLILLYAAPLLLGAIALNCQSLYMLYFTEKGYSNIIVALAISINGLTLLIGKAAYGFAANYLGHGKTSCLFLLLLIAGLVVGCFASYSKQLLFCSAALTGAGVSTTSVGMSIWVDDFVPAEKYDLETKRFQVFFAMGGLIFSLLPGIMADFFGGFLSVYILYIGFAFVVYIIVSQTYHTINIRC